MAESPAVRADSRRNRAAILAAARPLVAAVGPGAAPVTMAEVAAAAGVTRATLYRHFPDRTALVQALLLETADEVLPAVLGCLAEERMEVALDRLAQAVVEAGQRHRGLLRAAGVSLDQVARTVVDDEPLARRLAAWRADGQLVSASDDLWLALSARALCLVAVADDRPAPGVVADLARALRAVMSS